MHLAHVQCSLPTQTHLIAQNAYFSWLRHRLGRQSDASGSRIERLLCHVVRARYAVSVEVKYIGKDRCRCKTCFTVLRNRWPVEMLRAYVYTRTHLRCKGNVFYFFFLVFSFCCAKQT